MSTIYFVKEDENSPYPIIPEYDYYVMLEGKRYRIKSVIDCEIIEIENEKGWCRRVTAFGVDFVTSFGKKIELEALYPIYEELKLATCFLDDEIERRDNPPITLENVKEYYPEFNGTTLRELNYFLRKSAKIKQTKSPE